MTATIGEIKATTKDAEKVAEIRRIFGKDADAILQKYGTLAYDFMYENAKHNFKNFSYTSPENLHSKMKAFLLDQTTRPEDVVLYTAREQNWDWKVRASQVQEARKAAHKVVAAEKSAKPKAAAPASKVNWTAAQQASLKKWQGQAQLSDADYKKLEAKYGADLYKIMQNVVLQPSAVMSALKGGYKNSADTTQYLLSNTLSAEQVNKIVTLAHPQPQRAAASQAQSTDSNSNSEVNEVTVVGQKPVGKEKVLGIIPDPATAIYGVNKKIPELKLNNTTYETAAGRKARLEQEKKAKEERKKLVEKEASELAAKVKALKAAGKPVDAADVERLGALNTERSQLEDTLKQLKTDIKAASKEAKKAEKAAKKAEKEEKKKAKAEAKAKKKADKEAEATEATGEKKGNIFTRLFHRKKEEKDGGALKAAQKKQKDTQKAADKANKEAAKAENKQQAAYQEYRASAQKYDTQYMVTYSTKDRADLVKDKLDKETAAFLTDKNEDGTPKYKTVAEKEKALKAEKAAKEKEAKALLQKIKKDQANPVPGDENYFNRVSELDKQFSALSKQLTALDMDLATAQNIGKLSTEYTNLQKQFEKENKKRVSIVGEKSDKWSAYIKADYRAEVAKAEAKEKNAEAEKARQDLKDQLRSQHKVAKEGFYQTNATPEAQQKADENASKLDARLDEKPNETKVPTNETVTNVETEKSADSKTPTVVTLDGNGVSR